MSLGFKVEVAFLEAKTFRTLSPCPTRKKKKNHLAVPFFLFGATLFHSFAKRQPASGVT